ncbi:MAG: hypothetical protein FWB98_05965 [Defluviitaleaceae bacterium]|nr:hypothetical protein [Defluviitaleaceae bacterium]
MTLEKHFANLNKFFIAFLVIGLMFYATEDLFVMTYIAMFILVTLKAVLTPGEAKIKIVLIFAYVAIVVLQVFMIYRLIFVNNGTGDYAEQIHILRRFLAIAALIMPVLASRFIVAGRRANFHLPSIGSAATIGLAQLARLKNTAADTRKKLCLHNIRDAADELSRHNSRNYINNGSLTEEYFEDVKATMDDPNIYVIISKTGSPVSELMSIYTKKMYNHASLSFDCQLQTTVSYNGGQKVYPPGLNYEMIEFFNQTPDARILVYSITCTRQQKQKLADKIAQINKEGSAYNVTGLVTNKSYKPNIMFCSQFVYAMLDYIDLAPFKKPHRPVSPTDLIELDYYKKLKFVKEIRLNEED